MRRFMSLVAIAGVLLIAGCTSLPKGVDGDLVNSWATMATASQVLPKINTCYSYGFGNMQTNTSISCSSSHVAEVFFVGVFTDAAASATTPPKDGSSALLGVNGLCQDPAKKFLGEEWHNGLLTVSVIEPDAAGWTGGARWFACSAAVATSLDDSTPAASSGSLKGVLTKPGNLKLACIDWKYAKATYSNAQVGSCQKPHSAEFAGLFTMPGKSFPTTKQWNNIGGNGCESVVAHYLGFSGSQDRNSTVGWAWEYLSKTEWTAGNHTLRCYASAYTRDHRFTGTVKGIGSRAAKG